jgi:tetratricopeptide (TPR) repeat protein
MVDWGGRVAAWFFGVGVFAITVVLWLESAPQPWRGWRHDLVNVLSCISVVFLVAALFTGPAAIASLIRRRRLKRPEATPEVMAANLAGGPGQGGGLRPSGDGGLVVGEVADLELRVVRAVVDLPYIRRDVENEIRADLAAGRPVLLVGPSMVGKTRIAATLIKEMLPARGLLIPDGRDAFVSLGASAATPRDSVIFLDDVDRLIGAGGITQSAFRRLAEGNFIIGTIRALVYDTYQPTDRLRPPEWDVLSMFERVFVSRDLGPAEQERLREVVDDASTRERIIRTGIGEYVGAADRISEALRLGASASPVGLALIRGTADWARAGMTTPAPRALLPVLAAPHLDGRNRLDLADEQEFQGGLQWATRAINPTVSLLQREEQDTFSVFDYALDLIAGQGEPVPESTWPVLIEHASPEDLMNIGRTASAAGRPDVAMQAWRRCEDAGASQTAPWAALFLGAQLREQGDTDGAQDAYQRAIASGDTDAAPGAMFNLGNLLKQQGDLDGAKDAYQHAINSRHPRVTASAAVNLGRLLTSQGDTSGARDAYQRAVDSEPDIAGIEAHLRAQLAGRADAQTRPVHLQMIDVRRWRAEPRAVAVAAFSLGEILAKEGDAEGARAAFTRAAHSGDPDIAPKAAADLGLVLVHMGDIEEARIAYENAAAASHPEASPIAAFHLGILLAENGDLNGARDAYQRAVSFGTAQNTAPSARRTEAPYPDTSLKSPERDKAITTAALELGILLAEEGDLNGARVAYRHAVDLGHTGTAPWPMVRLALALIEHADTETAQAAWRSAVDTGHPPVVAVASLGLGNLLAREGDAEAAGAAFQQAIDSGYPQPADAASLGLGWLLADRGDLPAARDAFQRASRSEYPQIAEEAARNLQALPLARQAGEVPSERTPHHGAGQHDTIPADGSRASDPVLQRSTDVTDGDEQVNLE